jgi:CheY-like chemotaxis protein
MPTQRYRDENVLQAARRRVSFVFDNFENIIVSISGGKDSNATVQSAWVCVKEGRVQAPATATILFVDDEENILKALQRLTMDEAFDTEIAGSGDAALHKLTTLEHVALIVSDQRMPMMNGAEFLQQSQQLAPDAIRMLLTGYSDISAAADAITGNSVWGVAALLATSWDRNWR